MIRCRECRAILDAKALVCGTCQSVVPKDAEHFSPLDDEYTDCKSDAVTRGAPDEEARTEVLLVRRPSTKDRVVVPFVLATLVMVVSYLCAQLLLASVRRSDLRFCALLI